MEERGEASGASGPLFVYLRSAILALEPPDCIISLARKLGAGFLSIDVQNFILEQCIKSFMGEYDNPSYLKSILKKLIVCAESNYEEVAEGIYEKYASSISSSEDADSLDAKKRVIKRLSFLFSNCSSKNHSELNNFITPIRCSLNMLEGDTGCAIWPSSLFLSEFILSYPCIFRNKYCFELGSGVGLVGITLAKVNALKVMLTDGDISSLSNLQFNLEMNQLNGSNLVDNKYLQWETADKVYLESSPAEIILGADIVYNPDCVPHLLRVLSILLMRKVPSVCEGLADDCGNDANCSRSWRNNINPSCTETNHGREIWKTPVAYIATVIRNADTFNYFLRLAGETNLHVSDKTESMELSNLLPYMLSYDRNSVCLFEVSALTS